MIEDDYHRGRREKAEEVTKGILDGITSYQFLRDSVCDDDISELDMHRWIMEMCGQQENALCYELIRKGVLQQYNQGCSIEYIRAGIKEWFQREIPADMIRTWCGEDGACSDERLRNAVKNMKKERKMGKKLLSWKYGMDEESISTILQIYEGNGKVLLLESERLYEAGQKCLTELLKAIRAAGNKEDLDKALDEPASREELCKKYGVPQYKVR